MWKEISERKTFDAFFDQFGFQHYKTSHCNQSKKIIKKPGKVNNSDAVNEPIKSNKGKKKPKCQLFKERLATKVAEDEKELEELEKNKSGIPDRIGDIFYHEWKAEALARRNELDLWNNPPEKQKVQKILVDEVNDLIFDIGCVTMYTHDTFVRTAKDYSTTCNVYSCDNLVKYKISMNKSDEELYAFNAHYGWQIVNHSMYVQYPPKKLKLARDNPGKVIILASAGCRDRVINHTRALLQNTKKPKKGKKKAKYLVTKELQQDMAWKMHEVNKAHMPKMVNGDPIGDMMMNEWETEMESRMEQETTPTKKQTPDRLVVDEVDVSLFVPDNYRRHTSVEENSCVWLAACLLIRSVDIQVAEIMNKKYRENPALFEWLPCFIQKDAPLQNSLYLMMKNLDGCPYFVSRMRKIPQTFGNNIARYLIQTKDIVLLLTHDCQENSELPLSLNNLSRCCGRNRTFACFYHYCEIRPNNPQNRHV